VPDWRILRGSVGAPELNALTADPARRDRVDGLIELAADTPELVIDLDVVRANVERAAALARDAGVSLRPHTKTHKLPQIAQLQLEAGAVGVQVAKLGEAEVMADAGIEDVLVGYPMVGERKLARLADLAERAAITVTVDSAEVAAGLARTARDRGLTFRALLELDTGMNRLGVLPGRAEELAEQVAALGGIELAGVFTHEGHVYVRARDDAERERMTLESCRAAVEAGAELARRGLAGPVVSVGSAGTFRFAIRCPGVTEVRPGTYVFNDRSQIAQGACGPADLAAFAVATVVARPAPDRVVVDAGSKVLTSDRMLVPDPPASFGAVWGRDDWDVVRLSEEHGVVSVPPGAEARIGERVAIVPNHVCPAINLANGVTVVEGGRVAGRWPVAARGLVQ
jgi:D-serine deaminase-like pyridoxal phosphate-dependent protein